MGIWGERRIRDAAVVVSVIAIGAMGWLVGARTAKAAFTGTNGKIAFRRNVACPNDQTQSCEHIWVMNPDGSNQGDIEAGLAGSDSDPAWSPDSTQLAVASGDGLDVINADGSGRRNVTTIASPFQMSWSPASTGKIAFSDNCCGTSGDIHTINTDGSGLATPTNGQGINTDPAWSPANGSLIAFSSDGGGGVPSGPGIYKMDPSSNASSAVRIVPQSQNWDVWDASPDWSPDGSQLVFVGQDASSNSHIYVVNSDGTNLHEVATPSLDPAFFHPHWSPDGTKITFDANGPNAIDIWVMNADGSNQTDITNYPNTVTAQYPSWGSSGVSGVTTSTAAPTSTTSTTSPSGATTTSTTTPSSTTTTTAPSGTTTTTTTASTTTTTPSGATTTTIPSSTSTTTTTTTAPPGGSTTTTTPSSGTTTTTTPSNGTSSPGTALPGQPVTLSGGGFGVNVTLQITGCNPREFIATATSDGRGNFSVQVTIPTDATPGQTCHIAVAGEDPSGAPHQVNIDVAIPNGPSSQSPGQTSTSAASPGQQVTVSGGGFAPNQPVGITADNPSTSLGTTTSDASGNVSKQVTIPANATPGPENIAIVGPDPSGGTHKAVTSLTVAGSCGASSTTTSQSALSVNPSSVPVGQTTPVHLSGSGFGPNQCLVVTVFSDPINLGTTTADGNGAMSMTVQIPSTLAVGTHQIVVSGMGPSGQPVADVGTLDVVQSPPQSVAAQAVTATPSFTG